MACLPTQQIDTIGEDEVRIEEQSWCRIVNTSSRHVELQTMELKQQYFFSHDQPTIKIGRDPRSAIVLSHAGISSCHCIIEKGDDDQSFFITDTSTNGTYLDSMRLPKRTRQRAYFGSKIDIIRLQIGRISFVIHAPTLPEGSTLYNKKYRLGKNLGHGAYARVRVCVDTLTGRTYAMKICDLSKLGLTPGNTDGGAGGGDPEHDPFLSEVRILLKLKHHGIVQVHDYFRSQDKLHIVLDYLPAGDLLDFMLKQRRAFTEDEARDIFAQLVEATEYLHRANIVHRDIKPENILLDNTEYSQVPAAISHDQMHDLSLRPESQGDEDKIHVTQSMVNHYNRLPPLGPSGLRAKLTDFGLSRVVQVGDKMKTICGTPQYLAPEVLVMTDRRHQSPSFSTTGYDKSVDLWSLGAILFVMLTLSTPFPEDMLIERAKEGDYNKARLERTSPDARDLIDKLLTVDPAKRYTIQQVRVHPWIKSVLDTREDWIHKNQPESGAPSVLAPVEGTRKQPLRPIADGDEDDDDASLMSPVKRTRH